MNHLPQIIKYKEWEKAVSAYEFYVDLGLSLSHWSRWVKKNIVNNPYAIEWVDWIRHEGEKPINTEDYKGRPTVDFALTLDFAKRLAMMAHTDEGETVRNYFIAKEKEANQLKAQTFNPQTEDQLLLEAMNILTKRIDTAQKLLAEATEIIETQTPKVEVYDKLIETKGYVTISEGAKLIFSAEAYIGRNKFFDMLRNDGYLYKNSREPRQEWVNTGYFVVKEVIIPVPDGDSIIRTQTYITQHGLIKLIEKYRKNITQLKV